MSGCSRRRALTILSPALGITARERWFGSSEFAALDNTAESRSCNASTAPTAVPRPGCRYRCRSVANHVRTAQPMRPRPGYAYRQTFSSKAWSSSQPGLGQTNDDVLFFCPNHVRELTASKNASRCRLRSRSHARVGHPDRHAHPMCRASLLSSRNFQELLSG